MDIEAVRVSKKTLLETGPGSKLVPHQPSSFLQRTLHAQHATVTLYVLQKEPQSGTYRTRPTYRKHRNLQRSTHYCRTSDRNTRRPNH
jgi:hypothetical protein